MSEWITITDEKSLPPLGLPVWLWFPDSALRIRIGCREVKAAGWYWCEIMESCEFGWTEEGWDAWASEAEVEQAPTKWARLIDAPEEAHG